MRKQSASRAGWLFGVCAVATTAATSVATTAGAQQFERNRNVSVRERPQPEFDPIGVPVGAFRAYLTMPVGLTYVDNIFAVDTGEESDVVFNIQPDLELRSQWSRHELVLLAGVDHASYSDFDSENTTDADVGARGRIDFQRNTNARFQLSQAWNNEPRTNATTRGDTLEPVEYQVATASGGLSHAINRTKFDVDASLTDFNYDDTVTVTLTPVDQDFRDVSIRRLSGRASYAISPATAVFVRYEANDRDYDVAGPTARDSSGYTAFVGADFDITQLARGAISIGYLSQEYDSATFSDVDGLAVSASVEWFPTTLTTIEFGVERSVVDTGVVNTSGALSTVYSVRGDHELRRNVVVSGQLSFRDDDYNTPIDRSDEGLAAGLDATYLLNRHLGASVLYRYAERSSGGADAGTEFEQHSLGMRLLVRY